MILRRPSRIDPGHVLGSALVIALPFGAALAQQPAAPQLPAQATPPKADPDTIKQRDQELEAARTEQRRSAENQARLKREIETLSEDRRKLNQQLIDTATRVRSVETGIGAIEARLKPLDASEPRSRNRSTNAAP